MIEWVKVDRAAVLAARRNRANDRPADPTAVMVELAALVADGQLQHKSLRALAEEWGWNRGRLRRQIQRWLEWDALPWLDDIQPGKPLEDVLLPSWFRRLAEEDLGRLKSAREQKRTTSEPQTDQEQTTTPKASRVDTPTRGPRVNHKRTTSEPLTRAFPIETKTKTKNKRPINGRPSLQLVSSSKPERLEEARRVYDRWQELRAEWKAAEGLRHRRPSKPAPYLAFIDSQIGHEWRRLDPSAPPDIVTADDLILVLEYAHLAPISAQYVAYWRASDHMKPDPLLRIRTASGTLSKDPKLERNLTVARDWADDGRPTSASSPDLEDCLVLLERSHERGPPVVGGETRWRFERHHDAILAGLEAAGGWSRWFGASYGAQGETRRAFETALRRFQA